MMPSPWCPPDPVPRAWRTERLVLRAFEHADAPSLFAAIDSGREALGRWLPWARTEHLEPGITHFEIERFRRQWGAGSFEPGIGYVMAIVDAGTGEILGGTGLHRFDCAAHEAEIGYWIRPDRQGRGIATEATAHLLSWAFTAPHEGGWGLRRVTICCAESNTASRRVPEKLGLRLECHKLGHRWSEGVGWDGTLGWAVLAEAWDRTRHGLVASAR